MHKYKYKYKHKYPLSCLCSVNGLLGSVTQAGRTIEKGVFYVRLGRPVSGIASAHRQYHLVQSGEGLHRQPLLAIRKYLGELE